MNKIREMLRYAWMHARSFFYWVFQRKNYWKVFDGSGSIFESCNTCFWCEFEGNECNKILYEWTKEDQEIVQKAIIQKADLECVSESFERWLHLGYRCPHIGKSFVEDVVADILVKLKDATGKRNDELKKLAERLTDLANVEVL